MANLFAKAKAVPAPKKAAKKEREVVELNSAVKQFAELAALSDAIQGLMGTLAAEIKGEAFDRFVDTISATKRAPDSFDAVEDYATVNLQMRKRGTNSPLNDDEVATLEAAGLTVGEEVQVEEAFRVNPKFANDMKLLDKVSKALEKIVPEDFFEHQEKKFKRVVTADCFDAAFRTPTIDPTVIKTVTTMAVKPKLAQVDIGTILEDVKALLGDKIVTADE